MAVAQGINSTLGISLLAVPTTYGVVPMVTEAIAVSRIPIANEVLTGKAGRLSMDIGGKTVAGDIVTDLHYDSNDLIEAAMGKKTGQIYELTDDLDKVIQGLLQRASGSEKDFLRNGKVNAMTIAGGVNAPVTATFGTVFKTMDQNTTGTETFTGTPGNRVLFGDLTFKAGTSLNTLQISAFEISLTNNLQVDGFASSDGTNPVEQILTPERNGKRDVSIKFTIARVNPADTNYTSLVAARNNGTSIQVELNFVRSGKSVKIELSNLKIVGGGVPNVTGPVVLPAEFQCTAFRTASVDEVKITIVP